MKIGHFFKKAVSVIAASSMALSVTCVSPAMADEENSFDPDGSYHAALGLQTCSVKWLNRQAYYNAELNQYYETDNNNILWAGDPKSKGEVYEATFNDIELAGNGVYTVSVEHADFAEETALSQLYIATDIPMNDQIKVTDLIVTINRRKMVTFENAELEDQEKYTAGGMVILAINHWRSSLVKTLEDLGLSEDAQNGINLLRGMGDESISLTFTISGFNYDNPDAVAPTTEAPTTAAPTTAAPTTAAPTTAAAATETAATTTVAAATEEATKAPAESTTAAAETKAADKEGSGNILPIVGICAAVVVIIAVAFVFIKKKK